jgi:hypothetical protein
MLGLTNDRKELLKGYWLTYNLVRLNNSIRKLMHSETMKKIYLPTDFCMSMYPRLITVGDDLHQDNLRLQIMKPYRPVFYRAPFRQQLRHTQRPEDESTNGLDL